MPPGNNGAVATPTPASPPAPAPSAPPATPDVQTVLADDNFKSLGIADKDAVLRRVDPNYAALPDQERAKALGAIHYGTTLPPEGFWGALGNDIEGAAKGVGGILARPYTEAYRGYKESGVSGALSRGIVGAYYPLGNPVDAAQSVVEGEKREAAAGRSLPYRSAAAVARGTGVMDPTAQEQAADRGDVAGVAGHTVLPLVTATAPLTGEAIGAGARAFDERYLMPRRVISGKAGLLDALRVPGGKAGQRLSKMETEVETAAPHIAEIERTSPSTQKGAEAFAETAAKIRDYRDEFWDAAHTAPVARHAQMPFDAAPVVDAAKSAITPIDRDVNAVASARADSWIRSAFSRPKTIAEADGMVRLLNDELRNSDPSVYGPVEKRTMNAAVEALRSQIDAQLQAAGETGVKASNREWGALRAVEDRLRERYAAEAPKDARAGMLPDWVREYMFWHGGSPAVGVSMRIGKMVMPTEGGRLTGALSDLARTNLAPTPITTPSYVGKRPVAALPPAGGSSVSLTPMERGPQGGPGPSQTPPSLQMPPSSLPAPPRVEEASPATAAPLSQKASESAARSPLSRERMEDSLNQGIAEAQDIARDPSTNHVDRLAALQRVTELQQRLTEIVPPKVNRRGSVAAALRAGPPSFSQQIDELSQVIRDPNSPQEHIDAARQLRRELRTKRSAQNRADLEGIIGNMKDAIRAAADKHYQETIPFEASLEDLAKKLPKPPKP